MIVARSGIADLAASGVALLRALWSRQVSAA
jgi:hypothetical protein